MEFDGRRSEQVEPKTFGRFDLRGNLHEQAGLKHLKYVNDHDWCMHVIRLARLESWWAPIPSRPTPNLRGIRAIRARSYCRQWPHS